MKDTGKEVRPPAPLRSGLSLCFDIIRLLHFVVISATMVRNITKDSGDLDNEQM